MISLRQHIFSLVAVFVALAVGIAAGSTVVRGPLLDSTRARLESAEELIEVERAENDALAAELAQLDNWVVDGPDQLLRGRLSGLAVLTIVAGDVDPDVVAGVVRSIRATAGPFLGELRIDPAVFDPEQTDRVASVLGITLEPEADAAGDDVSADDVAALTMTAFGERIAERLPTVAEAIVTTVASEGSAGDGASTGGEVLRSVFGDLEDAGLVDLLEVNTRPVTAERMEVLVLTDRNLVHDPAAMLDSLITVSDPAGAAIDVLVAEVNRVAQDNETPVGSYVARIRDDGRLRDEVSTVDNAEIFLGWVAAVLGLEAAGAGSVGHYGFRDGADGAVPPRPAAPEG
ncbi:unannotated protein [freshwater metagenome]|uniref:Unannotated protein n=1 Tax=freshwater metagenome TaxID=449393 RepID=A0A6J6FT08_9ZZZZ